MALLYPGFVQQAAEIFNQTVPPGYLAKADGTFLDPATLGGVAAEFGENNGITSGQNTTSTTPVDVTGSSFTLPSSGTWEVSYEIYAINTTDGAGVTVEITDSLNNIVPNSYSWINGPGAGFQANLSQTVRITTTGASNYKLRWYVNVGTGTIVNSAAARGSSKVIWEKVSGNLPVLSEAVTYVKGSPVSSTVASGAAITWENIIGGIPHAAGVFTLEANKTYRLTASVVLNQGTDSLTYRWRNITANTLIGNVGLTVPHTNTAFGASSQSIAEAVITPTETTTVRLENTTGGTRTINVEGTVFIQQLGTSAITNLTQAIDNINPATPTSGLLLFNPPQYNPLGELAYKNTLGQTTILQRSIRFGQSHWLQAVGNSSTITSNGLTATGTGTATTRSVASTNIFTAAKRLGYVTAATAGLSCGMRHGFAQYFRNNGSGLGGYSVTMTFGISGFQSGMRVACGMSSTAGAFANAEPNTFLNFIGIIKDGTDTNYFIAHNDGTGTTTKINLGANFPATAANQAWIRLTLVAIPGTPVYYYVENLSNGSVASGTITTDLPTDATLLSPQIWANNAAVAAAVGIDFGVTCIDTLL